MAALSLQPSDLAFLQTRGIPAQMIYQQLELFERPSYYIALDRPCRLGDGIQQIDKDQIEACLAAHEEAVLAGRFQKFVPASGAASRMFKEVLQAYHQNTEGCLGEACPARMPLAGPWVGQCLLDCLPHLPFMASLAQVFPGGAAPLQQKIQTRACHEVLHYLLGPEGLNYARLPKALLLFHTSPEGSRTALEEHLVETGSYVKDRYGVGRCHFTIAPEHEGLYLRLLQQVRAEYESRYACELQVSFSFQKRRTDTIAVDLDNRPVRAADGTILFRPGGHGALIANLNDLQGDLVYIKNIDNVVPERLLGPVVRWKKILGGYLVRLQNQLHRYLWQLFFGPENGLLLAEAQKFASTALCLDLPAAMEFWPAHQRREYLISLLNRPLRVCGVVKNTGEPGGGPFWVRGSDGSISLQIVESAQIDKSSAEQQRLWQTSSHFNPVDLVCAVRDFQGRQFDLHQYVDRQAVFISRKSQDGRELKALELPGLWNGGMSAWITVFVEVPEVTFNPTKTVWDLLRPEHQ
ncbi:MAG: DUF4301 family protein [Desulfobacca sp.]|uniref:DUF4301 family protein n=1 Tax=Desulfobacca sp. TaxID=2067990 RepID=UPI00404B93C4